MNPTKTTKRPPARRIAGLALALGLASALLPAPAAAQAGTLDQQQTDTAGGGASILGGDFGIASSLAQTFTAGGSGLLDQVDLHLRRGLPTLPLTVEIRSTDAGGAPGTTDGSVLASAEVGAASVPASTAEWVAIPFTPPAQVAVGGRYAIVAYTADESDYLWSRRDEFADYAGGEAFHSLASPPASWSALPDADLAFKTYVAVVAPGADLSIQMSAPSSVKTRSLITYEIDVSNLGSASAENVVLSDAVPYGTTFDSLSAPGWECTTPQPKKDKAGLVRCARASLASGASATIDLTLKVTATPNAGVINNVATVSSDTEDPVSSNNAAHAQTTVTR
ncbi:MAG: DUF11 domain-containing protein [Actinomycetota bacterium]